jgi:hypothetical protein
LIAEQLAQGANRRQLCGGPEQLSCVGDDHSGLFGPFFVKVIERILQRRRISPIVLARDEDEGTRRRDFLAPKAGMLGRSLEEGRRTK